MNPTAQALGWTLIALSLTACARTRARAEAAEPREAFWRMGESMGEVLAQAAPLNSPQTTILTPAQRRELVISLAQQGFSYWEDGVLQRTGPISSGSAAHPTPKGRFRVLTKDPDKVSSRYTNQLGMPAWMPYAIQFHGHYFLHEGWLPGHPDSHGCIRLHEQDARFLFERL